MTANDAAVVVTLRADLKAYQAALRSAVRQTERAAQAAEKAVSDIGKRGPDFRAMNDNFRKSARQLENDARASQSRLQRIFSGFGAGPRIGALGSGRLLGGIVAGFSLQEAQQLIDASSRITNALKSAGLAGAELTKVYDDLFAIAQKNAVPIEDLVTLYSRLSLSQKELKVSQQELVRFTNTIASALRAGGQSAQQASGALMQLSQALGGGVVRAEEFNSILEGAPSIVQAAAAGLKEAGGSVAELRKLMIDGMVSSEAFFRAIEAGAPVLEKRLAGAESTISQAFVRLQNVLIDTAGKMDDATDASGSLARFLNGPLTKAIEDIGKIFTQVGDGPIGDFIKWVNLAVENVVQGAADIGAMSGMDQLGGNPYIGPTRIQQRIDDAFQGAVKPAVIEATKPNAVIKPVSIEDYRVEGEKAGDAYMAGLRQAFIGGQSDIEGFNKDFGQRLNQFIQDAARQGQKINIFSAHRTLERQAELYWDKVDKLMAQGMSQANAKQAARKWVAFPSPEAPHVKGIAADLKFDSAAAKQWAHDMAESYGLVFRMSHEGWHIELADQSKVREGRQRTVADLIANTQAEIALKEQINDINANSALTEDQRTMAIARATAEAERAALVERMLNEARQDGIDITPELTAQYEALAAKMQAASLRGEQLSIAMRNQKKASDETAAAMKQLLQTLADMAANAIVGFVQDLRNGVDAAEALYNAISRIADQLLSMALNMAIKALFNSLSGGIGGGLGGGLYASGGYTGDAPTHAPAGIVHGKEFVINAAATQKHRSLLEAINRGAPGYASGGFVLPSMRGAQMQPSAPAASLDARTTVVNTFDAGSFLSEALSRPDGVKVILNAVRSQPGAFRQAMQA